jgi:hypothetical protein
MRLSQSFAIRTVRMPRPGACEPATTSSPQLTRGSHGIVQATCSSGGLKPGFREYGMVVINATNDRLRSDRRIAHQPAVSPSKRCPCETATRAAQARPCPLCAPSWRRADREEVRRLVRGAQALADLRKGVRRLTGPIKIKVPTTLGFLRLNALVREFAELHPDVDVEVLLLDGR